MNERREEAIARIIRGVTAIVPVLYLLAAGLFALAGNDTTAILFIASACFIHIIWGGSERER